MRQSYHNGSPNFVSLNCFSLPRPSLAYGYKNNSGVADWHVNSSNKNKNAYVSHLVALKFMG